MGLNYDFIEKYNIRHNFLKIISYPLNSVFYNSIVFAITIKHILRGIFSGEKIDRFTLKDALNNYWYKTIAYNLHNHKRKHKIKLLSGKDFLIANWFYHSKLSLYPFWKYSVVTVFVGWILIAGSMGILFSQNNIFYNFASIFLTLIGSTYYSQLCHQNYNILGWIFFPFFIFYLEMFNLNGLTISITLMILMSFTVYVISVIFLISSFIFREILISDVFYILIPSAIIILYRILPILNKKYFFQVLKSVSNFIGILNLDPLYKRNSYKKITPYAILKILFLIIFIVVISKFQSPFLLFVTLGLLIINLFIARFADLQTLDMTVLLVSLYYVFQTQFLIVLFFYWFLISNQIPKMNFINDENSFLSLKILIPFKVEKLETKLKSFMRKLENTRILFSECDPKDKYENLFKNNRVLIEPFHHFSIIKQSLFFPTMWSAYDFNYKTAPNMWGRDLSNIESNMKYWKMEFLLYYTIGKEKIPNEILDKFLKIDELRWDEILSNSNNGIQKNNCVSWHLLKKK